MAENDQKRNPNAPESDILGDIDPLESDGQGSTGDRSGGSGSGAGGATADEEKEGVTGIGRRDSDRGRDNPQREPRTGPIG
jgi:hypothetical protein